MKTLCFVYIKNYRCLNDIKLVFDCNYNYDFDKKNNIINISDNYFPKDFWSKNIHSITGIVGNNGAGKSSIMSFLLDFLVEGSSSKSSESSDCVFILKENNHFCCYSKDIIVKYNQNNIDKITVLKFPTFYYSGHFIPYFNDNPRNRELKGSYIASDNVRLVNDLQHYYNEDSMHMNHTLLQHLNSHIAENNYRICMMLANKEISKIIQEYIQFEYVMIGINKSGQTAMNNDIRNKNIINKELNKPMIQAEIPYFTRKSDIYSEKDQIILEMIFHNLLNITYDLWGGWENGFDIINNWQTYIGEGTLLEQFRSFCESVKDETRRITLINLCKLVSNIYELTEINKNGNPILYIKSEKLEELIELVLKNNFYITSKFFDIYYAQSLNSITILSSGELELLNFLSRLYEAIIIRPNRYCNIEIPYLLLLDEAEIGFHPEWQRKYLSLIISFLDAIKSINKNIPKFQIIITTHSPILLSDIPKCCTNYLEKKNDKNNYTSNVISYNNIGETFAANVFNLYRMSFFMNKGLIGEFAVNKIKKLSDRIEKGETNDIINEIMLIGDNRIRNYLIEKLQTQNIQTQSSTNELIKYYEQRIEELRKKSSYE